MIFSSTTTKITSISYGKSDNTQRHTHQNKAGSKSNREELHPSSTTPVNIMHKNDKDNRFILIQIST
ncbi:hypothetical protein HYC85_008169 [Camellia sinensis]|uniref:Uncharacterized protein n=1 Tax=Camellia sinensis TaxID=4442 RepID=A0A7J7HR37_CAMSI|nr:hypothetical protein HYC85_008169 [Camellia sinensis]